MSELRHAVCWSLVSQAPRGIEALSVILRYLFEVSEPDPGVVRDLLLKQVGSPTVEGMMSTADKLREQGRIEGEAKGKVEGKIEGRAELLLKLLTLKFGSVAPATAERVRSASLDELDLWAERILSATSLQDEIGA